MKKEMLEHLKRVEASLREAREILPQSVIQPIEASLREARDYLREFYQDPDVDPENVIDAIHSVEWSSRAANSVASVEYAVSQLSDVAERWLDHATRFRSMGNDTTTTNGPSSTVTKQATTNHERAADRRPADLRPGDPRRSALTRTRAGPARFRPHLSAQAFARRIADLSRNSGTAATIVYPR